MEESEKLQLELASFRQQWHSEIQSKHESEKEATENDKVSEEEETSNEAKNASSGSAQDKKKGNQFENPDKEKEEKAAKLFLRGVEKERQKLMYEAIRFYKQAVHLVPDIESKITEYPAKHSQENNSSSEEEEPEDSELEHEASVHLSELTKQFKLLGVGGLCSQEFSSKQTHISVLPSELLIYILRWVVSEELDIRSLEQVSLVCKWFYACARDDSVWRTVCLRVWGVNCGSPSFYGGCWRRMLIERPHLHFNGVYISKNSYVRNGEQSLDAFYRPFHFVEYFRYFRFYADGTALACTTADAPTTVIPMLRRSQEIPSISKGYYRLVGDTVSIVTKRTQKSQTDSRSRRRQKEMASQEHVFHMELRLKGSGKRKNNQLQWINYSYFVNNKSTGQGYSNQIDVQGFKPFYFSRVKRFHNVSIAPL